MNHLSDDVYVNDDKENPDDRDELIKNQCHICELQLPNKVDLFDHVETDHSLCITQLDIISQIRNNL